MESIDPSTLDFSNIPLQPPPDGLESNFVNGVSRAWMPRLAIYTTLPVSIAFVLLRIYTRVRLANSLKADDYLCVAAAIATAGFCGVMLAEVWNNQGGRHAWDIPITTLAELPVTLKQILAVTALYCVAAALLKTALFFLYRRIFSSSRRSSIMIWAGIAITAVGYTAFFIVWVASNIPRPGKGGWAGSDNIERIGKINPPVGLGLGVLSTFTDFYTLAIPLTAISGLNMSRGRKLAVLALFLTGLLACGFSVAGIVARFDNYNSAIIRGQRDDYWLSMQAYALAIAEINLGIICACLPVVFPVFRNLAMQSKSIWSSWMDSFLSRETQDATLDTGRADDPRVKGRLPSVPKGTLSGLLSFVRGGRMPRTEKSQGSMVQTNDLELAPYSELRSVDLDYHAHIVPGSRGTGHGSTTRKS